MAEKRKTSVTQFTLNELFPKYKFSIAAMFDYTPERLENLKAMDFGPNLIRHILYHGQQKIVWLIAPDDEWRRRDEEEIMARRRAEGTAT